MSKEMVCVVRCHGFRGGTWDEGETVTVADGEKIPFGKRKGPYFIPVEDYADYKAGIKRSVPKNDPMKPSPQSLPGVTNLLTKGGMATTKTVAPKPGQDI
jgi:hypothetical protein